MAQNSSQSSSDDGKTGIFNPQVIIAIITLIGTLGVAYFTYRQVTDPINAQMKADQTAEARVVTRTAVAEATSLAFAMTLTSVAVKSPPTDTPTPDPPTNTPVPKPADTSTPQRVTDTPTLIPPTATATPEPPPTNTPTSPPPPTSTPTPSCGRLTSPPLGVRGNPTTPDNIPHYARTVEVKWESPPGCKIIVEYLQNQITIYKYPEPILSGKTDMLNIPLGWTEIKTWNPEDSSGLPTDNMHVILCEPAEDTGCRTN